MTGVEDSYRKVQPTRGTRARCQNYQIANTHNAINEHKAFAFFYTNTIRTSSVPLEDNVDAVSELLIGLESYQLLTQATLEGSWYEPVAVKTRLLRIVYGNIISYDTKVEVSINAHHVSNIS